MRRVVEMSAFMRRPTFSPKAVPAMAQTRQKALRIMFCWMNMSVEVW